MQHIKDINQIALKMRNKSKIKNLNNKLKFKPKSINNNEKNNFSFP